MAAENFMSKELILITGMKHDDKSGYKFEHTALTTSHVISLIALQVKLKQLNL